MSTEKVIGLLEFEKMQNIQSLNVIAVLLVLIEPLGFIVDVGREWNVQNEPRHIVLCAVPIGMARAEVSRLQPLVFPVAAAGRAARGIRVRFSHDVPARFIETNANVQRLEVERIANSEAAPSW